MAAPVLIYCHGGNEKAAQVAREAGWELGARSDYTIYPVARPLWLLDIEWRNFDWPRHMEVAKAERPVLAAVPDLEDPDQLTKTLERLEALATCAEHLLVIPKCEGVIDRMPRSVGGKPVWLGYSVPTKYGGTSLWLGDFAGWPIHLLGGSPRKQRELSLYLDVRSADGNMAWKLAQRGLFYDRRGSASGNSLPAADGCRFAGSVPREALRRSLENVWELWNR